MTDRGRRRSISPQAFFDSSNMLSDSTIEIEAAT